MQNKILKRIGECYEQLAVIIKCENLNLFLLTDIYKSTLLDKKSELIKHYKEISELLPKELLKLFSDNKYEAVHNYLISHYFLSLITLFETFLFDLQKIILLEYPQKISKLTIEFNDIIEAKNKEQIISFSIDKHLLSLSYKKPLEYKKYFLEIISAKTDFLNDEWILFTEMKTRRDLGVHNRWFLNDTYLRKIKEVGYNTKKMGNYLLPTEDYFNSSSDTISEMIKKIEDHCNLKFG